MIGALVSIYYNYVTDLVKLKTEYNKLIYLYQQMH
jgi:hypothetical protein